MRRLWVAWKDTRAGVTQADFEELAAEFCGESCREFFASAVFGRDDLDLQAAAAVAGLTINWRGRAGSSDKGGKPLTPSPTELAAPPDAGVSAVSDASGLLVKIVYDGGAAQQCGIAAGDIIVAIDRLSVLGKTMDDALARYQTGEEVLLHAFRHGELHEFTLVCQAPPQTACWLEPSDNGVLAGWLDEQDRQIQ